MHHSTYTHRPHPALATALLLGLLMSTLGGCAATSGDKEIDPAEDETFRPLGPASRSNDSIGKYLADLSTSITAWNEKTLTASSRHERDKQSLLEINIGERVRNRHMEILGELENGPERNRVIAAAALGFSGDPGDLSPLLAALDDPNEKVVSNAMLGLGTLASPQTPLHRIGELMRYCPHSKTRWSAAHCALALVAAGADPAGILEPAQVGMTDAEEPMVRAQSALILGLVEDTDSIEDLGNLLFDEVPIVSVSAAKALAYLSIRHGPHSADATRALYKAFSSGDRKLQQRVHPSLANATQRDYGLEMEDWELWMKKLP